MLEREQPIESAEPKLDALLDEAQRTYETRALIPHDEVMAQLQARRDHNRT